MHNGEEKDTKKETEKGDTNDIAKKGINQQSPFMEVEMTLDEAFDGDHEEITPGSFVSFRYSAWAGSAFPLNPKVSQIWYFFDFWNFFEFFLSICEIKCIIRVKTNPQYKGFM